MASNLAQQRDACLRFLFRVALPRVLIRLLRELKNGTSSDREELGRSARQVGNRLRDRLAVLRSEYEFDQVMTHQLREDRLEDQIRAVYVFSQITATRNHGRLLAHRIESLERRIAEAVPEMGDLPPQGAREMFEGIRKTYGLSEEDLGAPGS